MEKEKKRRRNCGRMLQQSIAIMASHHHHNCPRVPLLLPNTREWILAAVISCERRATGSAKTEASLNPIRFTYKSCRMSPNAFLSLSSHNMEAAVTTMHSRMVQPEVESSRGDL